MDPHAPQDPALTLMLPSSPLFCCQREAAGPELGRQVTSPGTPSGGLASKEPGTPRGAWPGAGAGLGPTQPAMHTHTHTHPPPALCPTVPPGGRGQGWSSQEPPGLAASRRQSRGPGARQTWPGSQTPRVLPALFSIFLPFAELERQQGPPTPPHPATSCQSRLPREPFTPRNCEIGRS